MYIYYNIMGQWLHIKYIYYKMWQFGPVKIWPFIAFCFSSNIDTALRPVGGLVILNTRHIWVWYNLCCKHSCHQYDWSKTKGVVNNYDWEEWEGCWNPLLKAKIILFVVPLVRLKIFCGSLFWVVTPLYSHAYNPEK